MNNTERKPGYNWLHTHPHMEEARDLPPDHVIVDRKDWEECIKLLSKPIIETPISPSPIMVTEKSCDNCYMHDQPEDNPYCNRCCEMSVYGKYQYWKPTETPKEITEDGVVYTLTCVVCGKPFKTPDAWKTHCEMCCYAPYPLKQVTDEEIHDSFCKYFATIFKSEERIIAHADIMLKEYKFMRDLLTNPK